MWILAIANFVLGAACGVRFGVSVLAPLVLIPIAELILLRVEAGAWLQTLWHGLVLLIAVEFGYIAGTLAHSARETFASWPGTAGSKPKPMTDVPSQLDIGSRR